MSRLLKFKEWLTIPEAAKQLSLLLEGEEVTEADILELGINKHLKISVHIPHQAYARKGKRVTLSDAKKVDFRPFREIMAHRKGETIDPEDEPEWIYTGIRTGENEVIDFEEEILNISGTWDLLMWGAERLYVEKLFYGLKSETYLDLTNIDGSFIQSYNEQVIFSLQEYFGDFKDYPKENLIQPLNHPNNYCPMDGIPQESFLVVRTEALREFEQRARIASATDEPRSKQEHQLAPKTINDYLRTIRALSNSLIGGLTGKHYSDAQTIATALKGNCPVSEKKLADYLKEASETPPKGK